MYEERTTALQESLAYYVNENNMLINRSKVIAEKPEEIKAEAEEISDVKDKNIRLKEHEK